MKTTHWLRLEGAVIFFIFIAFIIGNFGFSWWLVLLFFAPDISFIGYALGTRAGAWIYNLAHSYVLPMILLAMSYFCANMIDFSIVGGNYISLLWIAHIGFDRMLGYGLKETTGFSDTHLGRIGRL